MITGLKPYSTMKPSGVEGLGSVPEHWECRRLKTILQPVDRRSDTGKETLLSLRRDHGVVVYAEHFTRPPQAASLTGFKLVEVDELVVNRLQANNGLIFRSGIDGLISPDYSVFRKKHPVQMRFISEVCRTSYYRAQFRKEATGLGTGTAGFLRLYDNRFLDTRVHLPPLPEQQAIGRYLDHVDRRIQLYVSAKRRLIELLEQERQAVVNQAVTRGLDPNVRLKPSGVDWLGDVPEHWEVRRLRSLASIGTGSRDTANRVDDGEYPFFVRSQVVERIDTWAFDGEAVLTAGDGAGVGKVFHYINGKFDYHQRVYKFSDFRGLSGVFFFFYFRVMLRNEVLQGTAKATVESLRLPMLQNFPVALPPLAEQAAIVEYLNEAAFGTEAAISRTRRQIELMEEYRTRLVADVVTGKLDVRATAAQLPDQEDAEDWPEDGPADFLEDDDGIPEEPAEGQTIESEVAR